LKNRIDTSCGWCGEKITRPKSQISQNNFCSLSCSAKYQNSHKTTGFRRSKLEVFVQEKLQNHLLGVECLFNDRSAIGSELDIYCPELRFAVELNGILHYTPVYGESKFNKIQDNDKNKLSRCIDAGIELCVVDIASVNRWTDVKLEEYANMIITLIQDARCKRTAEVPDHR
jgi:hypothetical protein